MKRRFRFIPVALAAATVVTAGSVVAINASADPADSAIDWGPCENSTEVQCATIEVPLDHADPDGETIRIGLAKRPASNPDERIGSLLMDPGGPGGPGVEAIESGQSFTDAVNARFDLIGFDPRGVGTSSRIECDGDLLDQMEENPVPRDRDEFDARVRLNADYADSCRELTGDLVDHADTLNTVQDMEAIRRALGEGKLNFFGYSYGALMGQQYAEMFPENIRTMVLDGNMDHSLGGAWDLMRDATNAGEGTFTAFADWCAGSADCSLNGDDVLDDYADLKDRARAGDLTDPETGDPVDFYGLANIAFGANDPANWPQLADKLKQLRDGTGSVSLDGIVPAAKPVTDVVPHTFCADWDLPIDDYDQFARYQEKLSEASPNVEWTSYNEWVVQCLGNPVENTNPLGPLDIDGAPPIVMLGNLHDFATPYPWSRTAAGQSGATLITYEGFRHTVYSGRTDCVDKPVDDYLINGTVPDDGISCESVDVPGAEPEASSTPPPMPF